MVVFGKALSEHALAHRNEKLLQPPSKQCLKPITPRKAGATRWCTLKEKVVIPTEDENGLNARLSQHFGRAPYFVVVELEEGKVLSVQVVPNKSEHFGGNGRPPDRILQLRPNAVITFGMGPGALSRFQEAGVPVYRAQSDIVKEVVDAYVQGKLEELTEGCGKSRHREGCH